jgi:hypothetical protein
MKTTAVYVDDGSDFDLTGDEVRAWYVTPGDDDGEPTGKPVRCGSFAVAVRVADEMAARLGGVEAVTG